MSQFRKIHNKDKKKYKLSAEQEKLKELVNQQLLRKFPLSYRLISFFSDLWNAMGALFLVMTTFIVFVYASKEPSTLESVRKIDLESQIIFYVFFGLPAVIFYFINIRNIFRQSYLIRKGKLTIAFLEGTAFSTAKTPNPSKHGKFGFFSYADNHKKTHQLRTQRGSFTDEQEWVLFNENKPSISLLLQDFLYHIDLEDNGRFRFKLQGLPRFRLALSSLLHAVAAVFILMAFLNY